MRPPLESIWVYLSATPLLGLTVTLLAYLAAYRLYERAGFNPLANPVLIAVLLLVALLAATATPWRWPFRYTSSARSWRALRCRWPRAWWPAC